MSLNFTSDILPFYSTNIATDANYQAPGNFGLTDTLVGSPGVDHVTVGTAGSYTVQPTATSTGGATYQVRMKLVTVSAVAAAGTVYTPADVLTLAGGTATDSSHTSQLTVTTVKLVSATILAGGTGYGVTQTFNATVVGGTGTASVINVTGNAGGIVTTVNSITTPGSYTVLPTLSGAATTGGTGTGLTFNLVFGILAVTISRAGIYTTMPTNPVSVTGGTGTLATFTLAFGVDSLVVTAPGAYESGVAPTIVFSAGSAAATAVLASSTQQTDTQKLLVMVEIMRCLIAETGSTTQLKDIHEILRKIQAAMSFGSKTTYSGATTASRALSSAMNYVAKNKTHGGASI